ncbi:hypothetical protein Lbir_2037 [Legionella birminghamensis]|uniref:DUF4189 domain-containing protein n=1 Tax=Legionella birminghamensis TaxID=28083 RepID=A0A378I9X5_9GAMM|nr:hypothetical protein [Legionella birminghamensis]KTC69298.1 hypothetical protein Lbir_2037 [Legionella birminghamensis]STX31560.1 Uncharacterised protein [Legionella birminghamensis]
MIKQTSIALLLLCAGIPGFAESVVSQEKNWECRAQDQTKKQWLGISNYELTALNKAFDACKKESQFPLSCKISRSNCDGYVNGNSISPLWQCTAMDSDAQPWLSVYFRHRDDAVFSAKDYCRGHSNVPETCYVNIVTCKNINQQD